MRRWMSWAALALAVSAGPALGVGVLVPKDEAVPPLATKYLRVDAQVDNQVARTVVEQVFQNSTDRDLEARYVFPLPAGAAIRDFAMWMDGKRVSGEMVEKDKAAQVYQSIVARLRDPGLLEYLGNDLLRASVYPVPRKGTVKIQIEYSQVVRMESGLARYSFPLKTGDKASRVLEDFSVTVRLSSNVPLKSVYSPTHQVGINRRDDHHATIGMEVDKALLDRDFDLYYSVSRQDFGLNLITHRTAGEPGYFMLLIAPSTEVEEARIARKDVVFVLDISGSMAGPKIEQARKALSYCISRLRARDRFNVIAFSMDVDALATELLEASDEHKKKAQRFIAGLEAAGGTDINAALAKALAMEPDTVVFLTDGKPTVGVTDTKTIVANVEKARGRARVFVFGVDQEVNTHLLDQLSEVSGGTREYVTPSEDIEVKVSSFFNKASNPVLSRVSVDLPRVETADVYPRELGDLFQGEQVLVVGRYKNAADSTIVLRGEIEGEKKSCTYEGAFPETATDHAFIEGLWARRKVGYLLDQIRLHGENQELKDEVIRLSRRHGIITPYTSFLILESHDQYKEHGIVLNRLYDRAAGEGEARGRPVPVRPTQTGRGPGVRTGGQQGGPGPGAPAEPAFAPARTADELAQAATRDRAARQRFQALRRGEASPGRQPLTDDDQQDARAVLDALEKARKDMRESSGWRALALSSELKALRDATRDTAGDAGRQRQIPIRSVAGRTMVEYHGFWVDADWTPDLERVAVKYAGAAYFDLLKAEPRLKDLFALGTRLIVVLPSKVALVVSEDEGAGTLQAKEIQRLLTPAPRPAEQPRPTG